MVRDGSTVRAFLLPTFEYVTVMMTGIKVNELHEQLCSLHICRLYLAVLVSYLPRFSFHKGFKKIDTCSIRCHLRSFYMYFKFCQVTSNDTVSSLKFWFLFSSA